MTHAGDIGLVADNISFDWDKVMEKKNGVVKGLTGGIAGLFKKNGVTYIEGHGKIEGEGKLTVKNNDGKTETVEAKNIIIATGSEPTPFPGIEMDEKIFVSSTGALDLDKVPETLTIIGAGVIGLELGSVYARFGTEVTVVEFADRACSFMDTDISKQFQRSLKKQGINFIFNTKVTGGAIKDGKASLEIEGVKNGKKETLVSDICLVAIGRIPFTSGLGAKEAGIEINSKG